MSSSHARSHFFIAFRVLPRPRYEAITAVYRFCRRADDAVDENPDPADAERALAEVRAALDAAFARTGGDDALARAITAHGLPREPFDDLLEGVRWDLDGRRYATRDHLREYAYRVASTVGLLCVRIFGCGDGSCDRYAEELGIALQWTNILRDIAPDLSMGRVYLPADSMARHGVTEDDLRGSTTDGRRRLRALVTDEAAFARDRFRAAAAALPARHRRTVLAGEIMAEVYRVLLRRVERAGDRVLDGKVRVGALGRAAAFARVWARTGLASRGVHAA
jgi:phytoene synthase